MVSQNMGGRRQCYYFPIRKNVLTLNCAVTRGPGLLASLDPITLRPSPVGTRESSCYVEAEGYPCLAAVTFSKQRHALPSAPRPAHKKCGNEPRTTGRKCILQTKANLELT